MRRKSSLASLVAAGALAATVLLGAPPTGSAGLTGSDARTAAQHGSGTPAAADARPAPASKGWKHRQQWVNTWVAMPQLTEPWNLPPEPFTEDDRVLADATLRQTVHVSVGGDRLRLRFSNAFGGAELPISAAAVALPVEGKAGTDAIEPGTSQPVTFSGERSTVIPVGAQMVSDPLKLELPAQSNLTVTVYLADGQASTDITSHPGSRTTSHLLSGDHIGEPRLPDATGVNHWYFLSGVEVLADRGTRAVAILGDSLTDGRGSTTNGNDRWPDQLLARLQSHRHTRDIAVLNQAAGGNRVLHDGLGPNVLARLDRDVLAQSGVESLIVFEGVNDIGTAEATQRAQRQVAADLIAAYEQIVLRAHAHGIPVYGATLLPFGGNEMYDDPAGHREVARQTVNEWIRTGGRFDGVIDFDRAVRDPEHPRQLLPAADTGDHLHLNPTGYGMLADAVPWRLFGPGPFAERDAAPRT